MTKLRTHSFTRWEWGAIALLLLVTWLGARSLNADAYWVDEVIAIQRAGLVSYDADSSPVAVWQRTAQVSDQVPGYYMLLGLWGGLVGINPFMGRFPSLLFGVLAVATVFQIGKGLQNRRAGLAGAAMLAASAFFILFLHEMRMYALLVWMVSILFWCYWLIKRGTVTWWSQAGLVLSATMMMYSYYLSIVMIATLCFYHLFFGKKNREWWRVVGLMALAGALFLPWFLTSVSIFDDTSRNEIRQMFAQDRIAALVTIAEALSNKNNALLALLLIFAVRPGKPSHNYALFLLFFSVVAVSILDQFFGLFVNLRYALMLWVPAAMVVGLGINHIVERGVPLAPILAILLGLGVVSSLDQSVADGYDLPIRYMPWDHLVAITDEYEQEGDVLAFVVSIEGNDFEGVHEQRVMPHYFYDSLVEPYFFEDVRNLPDEPFLEEIAMLTVGAPRIWFSYPKKLPSWRNGMVLEQYREAGYRLCGNFADGDELYTDLYAQPAALEAASTLQFGNGDAVATFGNVQAIPGMVGDSLRLIHGWQLSDAFPRDTYSIAVHILDEAGNVVQQGDYGLPRDPFDCVMTTLDTATLPAGRYDVRVFVYAWQDNTRLAAISTGATDESFIIGSFRIER